MTDWKIEAVVKHLRVQVSFNGIYQFFTCGLWRIFEFVTFFLTIRQTLQLHLRYFATGIIYFFYFQPKTTNSFLFVFMFGQLIFILIRLSFWSFYVRVFLYALVHLLSTTKKKIKFKSQCWLDSADTRERKFDDYNDID